MKKEWLGFLVLAPMLAQAPPGWNQRTVLGSDMPGQGAWYGAGLWAADHHGPAASLTDSLGLGNGIDGGGFHLEAGYRTGNWDMAAEVLGNRNDQGQAYLTLYKSHLLYRGDTGWQGGFEQEPLVWGYGLNGGYLLGEAARPFPRARVESPMADLHLFRIPLGTWGWQAFMGRLENHPVLSSSIQDPSGRSRLLDSQGTPEAPMLMGYRVQAEFGPDVEFYANYTNLWSGTLNGQGMTDGYSFGNYLTAMFGLKDSLAEANTDYTNPGTTAAPSLTSRARSASEMDWGLRVQSPLVAEALGADTFHVYLSRGSKGMLWPVAVFLKSPARYFAKDVSKDVGNVVNPNLSSTWYQNSRYAAPSESVPNDTVGLLAAWPGLRAGLEYYAGVNAAGPGFRPFVHGQYLTGFYYYGDPLGNALGGETIATTAKLEVDFSPRLTGATKVTRGFRPFRDDLADWQADHPGQTAGKDRYTLLEQTIDFKARPGTSLGLGASWQREQAVENVAGATGNGFAWFGDVSFHWPVPRQGPRP